MRTVRLLVPLLFLAGCSSSARFVERRTDGGVVAVPTYKERNEALNLIKESVGPNATVVHEEEVITGSDVKTVTEVGNGSLLTRIGSWFTGTESVATTDTKTLKSTEWRITYSTFGPAIGDISSKGTKTGLTPASP